MKKIRDKKAEWMLSNIGEARGRGKVEKSGRWESRVEDENV